MDRRTFLKAAGVLTGSIGAGNLLTACGAGGGPQAGAIPEGNPTLNVISASLETLTGERQRVAVGITSHDNVPLRNGTVQLFLRTLEGQVHSGPYETEFFDGGGTALGVYRGFVDVTEPGNFELVAVSGSDHGGALINVVNPADSRLIVPGDPAIATPTPTPDNPLDAQALCTNQPPCGMHEVSLDAALGQGVPVALMFATPAYCQTAICGPAVQTLENVRTDGDWGATTFIHCEIFADAGVSLLEPVQVWQLPTEPWLFLVGADGTLRHRLDGPMIDQEIRDLLADLV